MSVLLTYFIFDEPLCVVDRIQVSCTDFNGNTLTVASDKASYQSVPPETVILEETDHLCSWFSIVYGTDFMGNSVTGADTDFLPEPIDYYGEYAFTVNVGIGSLLDATTPLEWKFTLDSVCSEDNFIHFIDDAVPPADPPVVVDILLAYNHDPACLLCQNPMRDTVDENSVTYDSSIDDLRSVTPQIIYIKDDAIQYNEEWCGPLVFTLTATSGVDTLTHITVDKPNMEISVPISLDWVTPSIYERNIEVVLSIHHEAAPTNYDSMTFHIYEVSCDVVT